MPPLVIPSTFQVRLTWSFNGTPWAQNVVHYIVPPAATNNETAVADLALDIQNAITGTTYLTFIDDAVALTTVDVRDLRQANLPIVTANIALNGTSVMEALPPDTAAVVTLRTAFAGARFRGRVYLFGFTPAANTGGGRIENATSVAIENWWADMMQHTVQGNVWDLAVMSRTNLSSTVVTGVEVRDDVWDRQARRKDGLPV